MASGGDDSGQGPTRPTVVRQAGRDNPAGGMESQNRSANARFQRNSAELQRRQAEKQAQVREASASEPEPKKELQFYEDRDIRSDMKRTGDELTKRQSGGLSFYEDKNPRDPNDRSR